MAGDPMVHFYVQTTADTQSASDLAAALDEARHALDLSDKMNRKLLADVMRMRRVLLAADQCLATMSPDRACSRVRARINQALRKTVQ